MGIFDGFGKKPEEKAKPDFSNVESGSSTTAPSAPVPADDSGRAAATTGSEQTYVVVAGDSLSKIAKRFYGDATKWPQIHEANRDQIKNPDLIHPGQKLKIPGV